MQKLHLAVDLRSLADPNFKHRGVGRLAGNILRYARTCAPSNIELTITGVLDRPINDLDQEIRSFVDAIESKPGVLAARKCDAFLSLSPMTHDPVFSARLAQDTAIFSAAVVYDFIQLLEPSRYIPTPAAKLDFAASMASLADYDFFAPISASTMGELRLRLSVDSANCAVIGAPINGQIAASADLPRRHVLFVGGADDRKRVNIAVSAFARNAQSHDYPLVIVGNYDRSDQNKLMALAAAEGLTGRRLEFRYNISDEQLAALYKSAAAALVPSSAEGFSLPVVEAMAGGAPVVCSDIPAHRELVRVPGALVPVDDVNGFAETLRRALMDEIFRNRLIRGQSDGWQKFMPDEHGQTFWDAFHAHYQRWYSQKRAPSIGNRCRPRLAFMSPAPPDQSGVSDYTAASLRALMRYADVSLFTPQPAAPLRGLVEQEVLHRWQYIDSRHDRTVSVIGNSHFHFDIFHYLRDYGGACIEHDNRLLGFYCALLGRERAAQVAEAELRRPLVSGELDLWLANEANLEATFLGEVAAWSEPVFFHSRVTQELVRSRFGGAPRYLPFSVYRNVSDALNPSARKSARDRLGIADDTFLISSFGIVGQAKAPLDCVWALEILRGWGINAAFHFVGGAGALGSAIRSLGKEIGVSDYLGLFDMYVSSSQYDDYLMASDVVVQLRTHTLGGLSGALMDGIASGTPCVANEDLAKAMEAPDYVMMVPDKPSPVLLAEAIAQQIELREVSTQDRRAKRDAWCAEHNMDNYARQLLIELGFEAPPARTPE